MRLPLLRRIERYLKQSGTSATRFGRQAARDPRLVSELRGGRMVRPRMRARLNAFLARAEKALKDGSCRRR